MPETRFAPETQHRFNPEKSSFWSNNLALILQLGLFAVLMMVVMAAVPEFYVPRNLSTLAEQVIPKTILAFALVLTTRLKGIDLSVNAVFAVSCWVLAGFMIENKMVPGLILALAAGLALGAVNSAVQMFIHIPSAALTMTVSAAVSFGITLMAGWIASIFWDGKPIVVRSEGEELSTFGVMPLIAALIFVLLLLFFTRLGAQGQLQKRHVFMTYAGSGLLFALAASFTAMRVLAIRPLVYGSAQILFVLFISGALLISRSAKPRIVPVVIALMATLNWSIFSNILVNFRANPYIQSITFLILTAAFIIPAFIVQRGCRSRI